MVATKGSDPVINKKISYVPALKYLYYSKNLNSLHLIFEWLFCNHNKTTVIVDPMIF